MVAKSVVKMVLEGFGTIVCKPQLEHTLTLVLLYALVLIPYPLLPDAHIRHTQVAHGRIVSAPDLVLLDLLFSLGFWICVSSKTLKKMFLNPKVDLGTLGP